MYYLQKAAKGLYPRTSPRIRPVSKWSGIGGHEGTLDSVLPAWHLSWQKALHWPSFVLVLQMQPLKSTATLSPPSHWDLQLLQQQACPMVPREQFLQLQQQLLQAERRSQHLQEELDNRTLETNTPQVQSASPPRRNQISCFALPSLEKPVGRWGCRAPSPIAVLPSWAAEPQNHSLAFALVWRFPFKLSACDSFARWYMTKDQGYLYVVHSCPNVLAWCLKRHKLSPRVGISADRHPQSSCTVWPAKVCGTPK